MLPKNRPVADVYKFNFFSMDILLYNIQFVDTVYMCNQAASVTLSLFILARTYLMKRQK